METIHVSGKRWFDKVNGNTYHSSKIYIDGNFFDRVNFAYGYGDHYLTTAFELLHRVGKIEMESNTQAPWRYCKENGIKFYSEVADITRKGDL